MIHRTPRCALFVTNSRNKLASRLTASRVKKRTSARRIAIALEAAEQAPCHCILKYIFFGVDPLDWRAIDGRTVQCVCGDPLSLNWSVGTLSRDVPRHHCPRTKSNSPVDGCAGSANCKIMFMVYEIGYEICHMARGSDTRRGGGYREHRLLLLLDSCLLVISGCGPCGYAQERPGI